MKIRHRAVTSLCVPSLVVATLAGTVSPGAASAQSRADSDAQVSSIAGSSASDVWAVGQAGATGAQTTTEAWHWNGHAWSASHPLSPCRYANYFDGATALSPDDVWAVGYCSDSMGARGKTLIEHYDGTSWHRVHSDNPSTFNYLTAVSASSADDVWAVGQSSPNPAGSIVEHWDGTSWSLVPAPAGAFESVKAFGPSDVWVADADGRQVYHYDGSGWAAVDTFDLPVGVGGTAGDDVWAVGAVGKKADQVGYASRFDGSTWTPTQVASVRGSSRALIAVSAVSPTDAWAIGATSFARGTHGYVEHWDGHSWSVVHKPGELDGGFDAIAAFGPDDAWIVGPIHGSTPLTNAEHWNGTTWKRYDLS